MSDYLIKGLSLLGPVPVGRVHLAWNPGLTVLYGANGAGKTSILRGIVSAVTGAAQASATAILHIQLMDSLDSKSAGDHPGGIRPILMSAARHRALEGPESWMDWGYSHPDAIDDQINDIHKSEKAAISTLLWRDTFYLPSEAELREEVLEQHSFAMLAAGDSARPSWASTVSASASSDSPALSRLLRSFRAAKSDGKAFLEEGPFAWSPSFNIGRPGLVATGTDDLVVSATEQWVTVPMSPIGLVETPTWAPRLITNMRQTDLNAATAEFLERSEATPILVAADGHGLRLRPDVEGRLAELGEVANAILGSLLLDAPTLHASIHPASEWLTDGVITWNANETISSSSIPLPQLSEAQRRWAEIAIRVALAECFEPDLHHVVVIDEPEQALHPGAIEHAASGVAALAQRLESPVFVASHSAAFVTVGSCRPVHVARDPKGQSAITNPDPFTGESLLRFIEAVGGKKEALLSTRTWLLVEGDHDAAVLSVLIGDELERSRTRILRLRGSDNVAGVTDAEFILRYTDANVLVVLDNASRQELREAWHTARKLAARGELGTAEQKLIEVNRRKLTREERAILQFFVAAVRGGFEGRVDYFSLNKRDIIYYLPVGAFVPSARNWGAIDRQRLKGEGIKDTIKRLTGTYPGTRVIRRAAKSMTSIPSQISALATRCLKASG